MRKARTTTRSPGRPTRLATGPRSRPQTTRRSGADGHLGLHLIEHLLGTAISLDIADPVPYQDLITLADDTFSWLHHIDRLFSAYYPDSEVSRLRRREIRIAQCSPEVRTVLDRCAELWRVTGGYFDPYATGALDPSGFVKGWALQLASDRLVTAGSHHHCLRAGGDVRVRGHMASGQPWRIGIHDPWQHPAVSCVVTGPNLAVATAGSVDRGPRVIDPHQGRPATQLRSVTVVGSDLGTADAYATAGLAMGTSALTWLASLEGHEAAVFAGDGRCYRSDGLPVAAGDAAAEG